MNMSGKKVLETTVNAPSQRIDISSLESGVYFVYFYLKNKKTLNEKLIVINR